ncbi:hypothetical protein CRUP_002872 [Coryphaenoides rupestris]|nr:hypothetical protein CRUP_002872 [Coryphaenoides rupestris]
MHGKRAEQICYRFGGNFLPFRRMCCLHLIRPLDTNTALHHLCSTTTTTTTTPSLVHHHHHHQQQQQQQQQQQPGLLQPLCFLAPEGSQCWEDSPGSWGSCLRFLGVLARVPAGSDVVISGPLGGPSGVRDLLHGISDPTDHIHLNVYSSNRVQPRSAWTRPDPRLRPDPPRAPSGLCCRPKRGDAGTANVKGNLVNSN